MAEPAVTGWWLLECGHYGHTVYDKHDDPSMTMFLRCRTCPSGEIDYSPPLPVNRRLVKPA